MDTHRASKARHPPATRKVTPMSIQFGYCPPIFAHPGSGFFRTPAFERLDPGKVLSLSILADKLGYDSLWVADHLMLGRDQAILEGWTMLSVLAGATTKARLGLIHQATQFRNPALMAKMAATLDLLSGGRFIWFADPGGSKPETVAYGLPWFDSADERLDRFEEALDLVLALWRGGQPINSVGTHFPVLNAICEPAPVQQPHPPIWMGSTTPRMHEICAKYGQGWNSTPVSVEQLQKVLQDLREACTRVGRDYETIEKTLEIQLLIASDMAGVRAQLLQMIQIDREIRPVSEALQAFLAGDTDELPEDMAKTWLAGTPEQVEQRIREYVDEGITHFMLWIVDAPSEAGLRLFAEAVKPRF